MEFAEMGAWLTAAGWIEQAVSELPQNRLNAGVEAVFSYRNKLSLRYHPEEMFIRLMIYGAGDARCLQLDYQDKLERVIEIIISIKDDLSLDSYLSQYLALQAICPVSILMVEQFL
jgi:hypothetical protein